MNRTDFVKVFHAFEYKKQPPKIGGCFLPF